MKPKSWIVQWSFAIALLPGALIGLQENVAAQEAGRKGPSKADIDQYKDLTEEQKNEFREFAKTVVQKFPEMSREERGDIIRAGLDAIANGKEFDPAVIGEPVEVETIALWPDVMPGPAPQVDGEERDVSKPDADLIADRPVIRLGHVSTPQIEVYRPKPFMSKRSAVVICPGGGFHILAQDLEGTEVAEWLNRMGITAVVLKYRVPTVGHGSDLVAGKGNPDFLLPKKALGPVMDAQRALALVHANAERWELDSDKIGMMGFSAGGQTAALAAIAAGEYLYEKTDEIDEASCGANFTMLIYPGGLADDETGQLNAFAKPNKLTPPMFFVHAANDRVTCLSSVALFGELKRAGVPAELHVFETGGHGYGLRPTAEEITTWPGLARQWMEKRGVFGDLR